MINVKLSQKHDNVHGIKKNYIFKYIYHDLNEYINNMLSITDDGKVPYKNSYTLHTFLGMRCCLAPNRLVTQLVNWVKSIVS